jgi:DNA helicase HerA-like ATPase
MERRSRALSDWNNIVHLLWRTLPHVLSFPTRTAADNGFPMKELHLQRGFPMSIGTKKLQVLHILSQNLNNPEPQLVRSHDIAHQLHLSLAETHLLLKVMNDQGVIESNVDHQLSLITRKGLQVLNREIAL